MYGMPKWLLGIWIVVCLGACDAPPTKRGSALDTLLTDDLGRQVRVVLPLKRLLPMAPSLTEMLFALADTQQIIGRTPNCNFPAACLGKPIVQNYPVNIEGVLLLQPDLVFTKDGMMAPAEMERLNALNIPVYVQKYETVEDIFEGLITLGRLTNHKDRALHLTDSLKKEQKLLLEKVQGQKAKKILLLASRQELYAYGKETYASDMLKLAGGVNVLTEKLNSPYPQLTREYILALDPEIIFGGGKPDAGDDIFTLYPELKRTKAYQTKSCYDLPPDLISRPGPRVLEGVRLMQSFIHPEFPKP